MDRLKETVRKLTPHEVSAGGQLCPQPPRAILRKRAGRARADWIINAGATTTSTSWACSA